jgi:PhnB protein
VSYDLAMSENQTSVIPAMQIPNAAGALDFLMRVFDAELIDRYDNEDGTVGHAEVKIGASVVMLGESPERRPATLYVHVPDVDATYRRALDAGATSLASPEDQFYGARVGRVEDPFGNRYALATQVRQMTIEETHAAFEAL